jgi:hypothetical protein
MSPEISGSCLCGKVRFLVHGPFHQFRLCHCSRCRKATGSAHGSNLFTNAENIRWLSGEELIKGFELKTAKFFSKRFCSECGSPLPWLSRRNGSLIIPAGLLDDDPGVRPEYRTFFRDCAAWYKDVESVPCTEQHPD